MFDALAIEGVRLQTIARIRRLIAAHQKHAIAPSEWAGWQVLNPDGQRERYARRVAGGDCSRCGAPRETAHRLCLHCREGARERSRAFRRRRKAAGRCTDCHGRTTGRHVRCRACRERIRAA